MSVKRKGKTFSAQKAAIIRSLCTKTKVKKAMQPYIDEVEKVLKDIYEQTLANWEGRSDSGRGRTHPQPTFWMEWKITVRAKCVVDIRIFSQMREGNNISELWYWIDRGVKYTTDKPSAVFPIRAARRTDGGGLNPGANPGFLTDARGKPRTARLPEGWQIERAGTRWSGLIGEEFKGKISGKDGAKVTFITKGRKTIGLRN